MNKRVAQLVCRPGLQRALLVFVRLCPSFSFSAQQSFTRMDWPAGTNTDVHGCNRLTAQQAEVGQLTGRLVFSTLTLSPQQQVRASQVA